ncbi:MAG: aminotransferase class I/II-fold pyridoxal phosphate-dependent enzyme, partial [Cyanobacteria bacterium]|nr:aminotransferase class I/II-fold pyridoxal phosphate-dependent enzyme [Cyanobacteriota bacterium]
DPLTLAAALGSLTTPEASQHIQEMVQFVLAEKKKLYAFFESLSIRYVPSYSNFIYFETGSSLTSQELFDQLARQGVIIRPVLPGSARVNVGTSEENQHFMRAMSVIYKP